MASLDGESPRKVSFALDYGMEPEPGEILRFIEGADWTGDWAAVEIQKKNVDVGDEKVCVICKEASREGWIDVGEVFGDLKANAPHHPNCRCKTDYRTRTTTSKDLHLGAKSGNPWRHPLTGRFSGK